MKKEKAKKFHQSWKIQMKGNTVTLRVTHKTYMTWVANYVQ